MTLRDKVEIEKGVKYIEKGVTSFMNNPIVDTRIIRIAAPDNVCENRRGRFDSF